MADYQLVMELDCTALIDATEQIIAIARALPYRHGQQFRALDQKISALAHTDSGRPTLHELDAFHLMAVPSQAMTDVLKQARALGMIR